MTLERHALALAFAHLLSTGAITSSTGSAGELAQEAELALAKEGYEILPMDLTKPSVTPMIVSVDGQAVPVQDLICRCADLRGCIRHPFGPRPF